ncbi:hypothetical protein M8J76_002048 [Diaphorina citri]|nr:hypothetical protein M8J76_002048 [Diaphorina citri]
MPPLRDLAYSEGCEMKHRAKGHSKRCDSSILKRGSEMEEVPGRKSFTKGHSKRCDLSILKRGSEIEESARGPIIDRWSAHVPRMADSRPVDRELADSRPVDRLLADGRPMYREWPIVGPWTENWPIVGSGTEHRGRPGHGAKVSRREA